MKNKKGILIVLAVLIVAAIGAGIYFLIPKKAADVITVTVFRGEPGDQPTDDNRIYKKIRDELGIRFEFEFLTRNLDETLSMKLAEGKYPDLFDGGNSAEMLEDAGVLIDLLPYISEEKTPNLYKHLYTNDRINQLLTDDGKLYIIPNYGITYNEQIQNDCNGPAFFIQKQVIVWNNYQIPATLNEYFDLIERFITANPETKDGAKYTGFAILCDDWRHFCLINPVQHLMGRPNDGEVIVDITTPDYKTETFINQPYAKAYYAKLNEEFHKEINGGYPMINRDTFTMNYDQYITALSDGTILGMFDQTWDFAAATDSLIAAGMYENTYLAIPLVYDPEYVDGKVIEEHYLNGTVMNKDRGFGISISCPWPEKMIQMMETFLSDEWQKLFQWGVEGKDYTVKNGRMLMTEEQYKHLSDSEWKRANKADAIWSSCPKKQGTMDDGNAWDPGNQPEIYFDQMSDYDKAFLSACGKKTPAEFFNPPIELAPYGEAWQIDKDPIDVEYSDFNQIQDEQLPKIIMCDPSELDGMWDAFVDEISYSCQVYSEYMQKEVLKLVEQAKN